MYCLFISRSPPVTIPIQMGCRISMPIDNLLHSRSGLLSSGEPFTGLHLPFYKDRMGKTGLLPASRQNRYHPYPFPQNIDNHDQQHSFTNAPQR